MKKGNNLLPQSRNAKITVLNPRGQPPPLALIPMAPRFGTLDNKTIYIVDVKFPLTHQLFEEMQKLLAERYPKVNWVLREKAGTYFDDNPKLWAEIKEKGNAQPTIYFCPPSYFEQISLGMSKISRG
jgi:hypothetical protein